jgi:hypothetical protein
MERITAALRRFLTPRVSPMVYTMMAVSIFIGFCFSTGLLVQNGESLLFSNGAIIPIRQWGGLLFLATFVAEIGLAIKHWGLVSTGAFFAFGLWLLASIDLTMNHHWYALVILGVFHMVFQAYVYLGASIGILERTSHND